MNGEFGGFTVNGGWLVFLALVALWVALAIESRSRRLSSLLEAALKEAGRPRVESARAGADAGVARLGPELEQLAAAVDSEGRRATARPQDGEAVHPGHRPG
ncbi:MAG: hypothetical protein C0504_14795 [Candidatus Solibacter sp.]|nr:hypothetical protein [Candidatus Solibacter sp.]